MKKKELLCWLALLSLLFSATPAVAQTPKPPLPLSPSPVPHARPSLPPGPDGEPLAGGPVAAPGMLKANSVPLGPSGTSFRYLTRFGVTGQPYLVDNRHLDNPTGLFINGSDQLYVAEEFGDRVLKFDLTNPTPTDPPTASLVLGHAGQAWAHDDFLNTPWAATEDGGGNIWVVANSFVKEFDSAGNVVKTIPPNPWEQGSDNYHFNRPYGIAFGPGGYLYVSDQQNHRIQIYDVTGTPNYIATIGETGVTHTDNSGFNQPMQIAFDSLQQLYVMDWANQRVQLCTSSSPWTAWNCAPFFGVTGESGNDASHLNWAMSIGIDSSDNIFLGDGLNFRVLKCNTGGTCASFAGVPGERGSDNAHLGFPTGVTADTEHLYISDANNARIQVFSSAGVYEDTLGYTGVPYLTDTKRLNTPWGIAVGPDGSIYVGESWGRRLIKMNAAGVQQWTVGTPGVEGNDNYHFASDLEGNLAVDSNGRVYAADWANNRVQIYNSNGTYFATLGTGWGLGDYQFSCPLGMAISPVNGDIYVNDDCNHRVQVYTSARVYKATIGQSGHAGSDNWSFRYPQGVVVDRNGNIYVADTGNYRVQKCTLDSGCTTFVGVEGSNSSIPNGASVSDFSHLSPVSVAVDNAGRVYVADAASQRVQVFDASGAYLASIGGRWGTGSGELINPSGVAVDSSGNVYVADKDNQRVEKFAPGYPNWTQVNINAFGNVANLAIWSMQVFNGKIYAGVQNADTGAEIWRTGNGTAWAPFSTPSYGADAVMDMEVFGGKLYAGLSNSYNGGELWRTDGTSWEQLTGNGFDDPNNYAINALAVYGGQPYAATSANDKVMKVYRTTDGTTWNPVTPGGLGSGPVAQDVTMYVRGGYLYLGLTRGLDPNWTAELWRTSNGTTWTSVFTGGLGNSDNTSVSGMADFN